MIYHAKLLVHADCDFAVDLRAAASADGRRQRPAGLAADRSRLADAVRSSSSASRRRRSSSCRSEPEPNEPPPKKRVDPIRSTEHDVPRRGDTLRTELLDDCATALAWLDVDESTACRTVPALVPIAASPLSRVTSPLDVALHEGERGWRGAPPRGTSSARSSWRRPGRAARGRRLRRPSSRRSRFP